MTLASRPAYVPPRRNREEPSPQPASLVEPVEPTGVLRVALVFGELRLEGALGPDPVLHPKLVEEPGGDRREGRRARRGRLGAGTELHGQAEKVRLPLHEVAVLGEPAVDAVAAAALGGRPDVPALLVTRTAWDAEGQPIEFARDLYRGDRLAFVTETSEARE